MKLFGYWRSSSTWRVRIALNLKGVDYVYQPVHLLRGGGEQHDDAYRGLNPRGEVPVLEVEERGAVQHLAQSVAIIEYLEERYPRPPLLPRDPLDRAFTRQMAEMVNSGIQPLHNLSVLNYVRDELHGDDKAWARRFVERGLAALEATALQRSGRFLLGDSVTLADLYLVPQLYTARRYGVDLAAVPTLVRVEAACAELPAFQRAHADKQIDAEPAPR
jgi:maleylpyruvate isomerase